MDSNKETKATKDACSDDLIKPLLLGLTLCLTLLAPSSKVSSSWVIIFLPASKEMVSFPLITIKEVGTYGLLGVTHCLPLTRAPCNRRLDVGSAVILCPCVLVSYMLKVAGIILSIFPLKRTHLYTYRKKPDSGRPVSRPRIRGRPLAALRRFSSFKMRGSTCSRQSSMRFL